MHTTTITERGQISIPAEIRKTLHLKPGMGMVWIVRDKGIFMMPVPKDPIAAFRGSCKGVGTEDLLRERAKDKAREEAKLNRWIK